MTELRQRQPRVEDKAFLAFVRAHRCCACRAVPPVQAAHIRVGSRAHQKRPTGIGEKPGDRWSVPLCVDCHLDGPGALHKVGEEPFWRAAAVDPFALARCLYSAFLSSNSAVEVGHQKRKRERKTPVRPREWLGRAGTIFRSSANKSKPKRKWPKRSFPKRRKR